MAQSIEWFVEPTGDVARANQVFARELGPAEEYAGEYEDEARNVRQAWARRSYAQALRFWKSRATLGITFDVWNRDRNYGPIRFVTFLMPRPRVARPINPKPRAVAS